jgi:hypothetical protein
MRIAHRQTLVALIFVLVLLGCSAAATAAPARTTSAANLCTTAKAVAKTLIHPPTASTLSTSQGQALIKKNLSRILGAKSALIAASPSKLKASMRQALGVFALFRTDLQKVNYNFAALIQKPALAAALAAAAEKAQPAFHRLQLYFTNTCHFK